MRLSKLDLPAAVEAFPRWNLQPRGICQTRSSTSRTRRKGFFPAQCKELEVNMAVIFIRQLPKPCWIMNLMTITARYRLNETSELYFIACAIAEVVSLLARLFQILTHCIRTNIVFSVPRFRSPNRRIRTVLQLPQIFNWTGIFSNKRVRDGVEK